MKLNALTSRAAVFTTALLLTSGSALAGDLFNRGGSLKDAPVAAERPELSANVAITSELCFPWGFPNGRRASYSRWF